MTKLLRSAFFAAMLVCGSAQALIVDLGVNPSNASISHEPGPAGGSFSDTVLFTLSGAGGLVSDAFSNWPVPTAGLRNLTLELFQGSNLITSVGPSTVQFPGGVTPVFTEIALTQFLASPGQYRLVLSGDVRPDGGFYNWDVSTVTAAIPEPEQWALLIAGLALVAGVARRRSKASAA